MSDWLLVSVNLTAKAEKDLEYLVEKTELSQTDLINRAIQLYAFVEGETSIGNELAICDPAKGTVKRVELT